MIWDVIALIMTSLQWKTTEIPIGNMSLQSIATEVIQNYIKTNQSQKGDTSQLETMFHSPLTVLMPPGKGYVAV